MGGEKRGPAARRDISLKSQCCRPFPTAFVDVNSLMIQGVVDLDSNLAGLRSSFLRRVALWRAGELYELDGEYFPGKILIITFGCPPNYRWIQTVTILVP